MGKTRPLALLFLAAVPLSVIHVAHFFVIIPGALDGYVDFRHLYTAGYMLRCGHGSELYNYDTTRTFQNQLVSEAGGDLTLPFNHLAYEALFFAVFSLLKYRTAYLAFVLFNLGLLACCFRVLKSNFGDLSQLPRWLPLALPLGFLPPVFALSEGQDSIILLALAVIAFALLQRGREMQAGAVLAMTLFKFQFSIPIVILYCCWRRWGLVRGFAICGAAILALSFIIVGPTGTRVYAHELVSMSAHLSADRELRYGIHPNLMVNLRGFLYATAYGRLSQTAIQFMGAILSIAALLWSSTKRPSFPLAIAVSVLVSYHCFMYDATLLLIPLVALAAAESTRRVGVACALLASPTIFLYTGHRFYLIVLPLSVLIVVLAQSGFPARYRATAEPEHDPIPIPTPGPFRPTSQRSRPSIEPEELS